MKTIFANTFFIIIILSTIVFPQKSAFTISDLYKIRNVGAPVISYDGKMIAFTITDNDLPKGTSTTKISVMNEDGSNLKSIPDTSKNIYVEFKRDNKDNFVTIVSDNGNGVPENEIDNIFEPFKVLNGKGNGLGLSLVRKGAEFHNGTVELQNDNGAKFIVTLEHCFDYE